MLDEVFGTLFISQWLVFAVAVVLLLVSAEVGYRFGLRLHRASDQARQGQIGTTQGAVLGILALLLAFTFSMAVNRYETRRELVLQEANAIGTTYLRASFLPDAHKTAIEGLLRRYVDVRLDFYGAEEEETKIGAAEQAAAQIQHELWTHAVAAGKETPTTLAAIFMNALNETIDLDATRLHALRTHVPGAVWLLVLAVAACGCCANGYGAGASGARSMFTNAMLPLLIAVAITLVVDLDRPRAGLIGVNQQPLLDLKQSLQSSRP
jgi:hypothetical protein